MAKPKIEEWKDIEGYEGYYQVSSFGNIRSLDRLIDFPSRWHGGSMVKRIRKGHIMKPGSSPRGYSIASLSKLSVHKYYSVHRLVAMTFIPNPENKPQVNHINGIKTDNRVENLEWVTPSENIQHSVDTGLQPKPVKMPKKKLNYGKVRRIRESNLGIGDLCKMFDITPKTVNRILSRKTWKQI